jgi:hypothetical protein
MRRRTLRSAALATAMMLVMVLPTLGAVDTHFTRHDVQIDDRCNTSAEVFRLHLFTNNDQDGATFVICGTIQNLGNFLCYRNGDFCQFPPACVRPLLDCYSWNDKASSTRVTFIDGSPPFNYRCVVLRENTGLSGGKRKLFKGTVDDLGAKNDWASSVTASSAC